MALFLAAALLGTGAFAAGHKAPDGKRGILGGPAGVSLSSEPGESNLALGMAQGNAIIPDEPYNIGSQPAGASSGYLAASFESRGSLSAVSARGKTDSGKLALAAIAAPGTLKSLRGYFIQPALGWNWGILHPHNGVDIANACGTPVKAAAEGVVVEAKASGWNGGYGAYIVIEHPNETRTRYAHLQALKSDLGSYVKQGELIGLMGESGESTGCHLHFEVEGGKNPFSK